MQKRLSTLTKTGLIAMIAFALSYCGDSTKRANHSNTKSNTDANMQVSKVEMSEAVPIYSECFVDSAITEKDFVLFDGFQIDSGIKSEFMLNGNWTVGGTWGDGELGVEDVGEGGIGKALYYTKTEQFTGFQFFPPAQDDEPRSFSFSGIDFYVDYQTTKSNDKLPGFGMRLYYLGEPDPSTHGGHPDARWLVSEFQGSDPRANIPQTKTCNLIHLDPPENWDWDQPGNKAYKLLVELWTGHTKSDKLRIRRMVLKDFKYTEQ